MDSNAQTNLQVPEEVHAAIVYGIQTEPKATDFNGRRTLKGSSFPQFDGSSFC